MSLQDQEVELCKPDITIHQHVKNIYENNQFHLDRDEIAQALVIQVVLKWNEKLNGLIHFICKPKLAWLVS
jgi:hypothetical protein